MFNYEGRLKGANLLLFLFTFKKYDEEMLLYVIISLVATMTENQLKRKTIFAKILFNVTINLEFHLSLNTEVTRLMCQREVKSL